MMSRLMGIFTLLVFAVVVNTKAELLPGQPENSYVPSHAPTEWRCHKGYKKSGNQCVSIFADMAGGQPENSYVPSHAPTEWRCHKGYKKSGNQCVSIFADMAGGQPENSYVPSHAPTEWRCHKGYKKSGNQCVSIFADMAGGQPENSYVPSHAPTEWRCHKGYKKSGNQCISIFADMAGGQPENSYVPSHAPTEWRCHKGYKKSGNQCVSIFADMAGGQPENSYVPSHAPTEWRCHKGYKKSGNQCVSIFADMAGGQPENSYVPSHAPTEWRCHKGYKKSGNQCVSIFADMAGGRPENETRNKLDAAALTAAEKEAERLRQKVVALEAEKAKQEQRISKEAERLRQLLAALEAKQKQQQQTISSDAELPSITIVSVDTKGKQGIIKGNARDNTGVAEVAVDGSPVPVNSNGSFEYRTFVPANGISVQVQATDLAGLTSVMSVSLERSANTATTAITFDRLNPLGKQVVANPNALALIVGVADYENTPAKAIFADSDALMFRDYASEKLGIPENRIKTLVNETADIADILLSVKNWLARMAKQEQSDIYIFFAGHGLTSEEPRRLYLFPYDGAPKLLKRTALLRDELFSEVAATKPRSVTVFLDTCYSGITRGDETLVANRPIIIAPKESIPERFTVMTAAAGDQTAKPLEEAKHGMFSYFLMKGMEGEADVNQDNQITAGELHAYVQQNVIQQSSGSQTPELQGDADRVLVRFQ